jgi:hypothetical protein
MDIRTFKVAGISTDPKGSTKVRFANDFVQRIKTLNMRKHTDINLIELSQPMNKADICDHLLSLDNFQTEVAQSAISQFVKRNVSKPAVEITETPAETSITEQA